MTVSTFWLSHINRIATATDFSHTGAALTAEANLWDESPGTLFRIDGVTTIHGTVLQANWSGVAYPIGVVALLNTNLQLGDSVTFTLYDETLITEITSQTVELHTDPELGYPSNFIWAMPANLSVGRVTATINAASSPTETILDCGLMWAGPRWCPAHGVNFQVQPEIVDPSEVAYSRGQQAIVNSRVPFRQLLLSFPALYEHEVFGQYGATATNLYDIFFRNGSRLRVLSGLIGDTDPYTNAQAFLVNRMALYGLMSGQLRPQPFDSADEGRVYTAQITIRENR